MNLTHPLDPLNKIILPKPIPQLEKKNWKLDYVAEVSKSFLLKL